MGWSKDHGTIAKVNADYAKEQANVAKQESTNLAELKTNVEAATQNASTAAENANAVIEDANLAASNADSAASEAIAQANHAKNEGDRAKAEADRLVGTDVSKLDNKITEVTTQLAQTDNKIRNVQGLNATSLKIDKKSYTVFITDDANQADYYLFKDRFSSRNVPCNTAVIVNNIALPNKSTLAQLKELQNVYGWEMLSHTKTHQYLTQLTDTQLEEELKGSVDWLNANGLHCESISYPYGDFDDRVKRFARKYYRAGRTSNRGVGYNKLPLATHELDGLWIGKDVAGQTSYGGHPVNTFGHYKSAIDKANENGSLVIISFHSGAFDDGSFLTLFEQVLDYAVENSRVVTLSEALNRMGNIMEIGDVSKSSNSYKPHVAIGSDGSLISDRAKIKYAPIDSYGGLNKYTDFEEFTTTVNLLTHTKATEGGMPFVSGGTLTTHRHGTTSAVSSILYNYQEFTPIGTTDIYRRAIDANGNWLPWSKFAKDIGNTWEQIELMNGCTGKIECNKDSFENVSIAVKINTVGIAGGEIQVALIPYKYRPRAIVPVPTMRGTSPFNVENGLILRPNGQLVIRNPLASTLTVGTDIFLETTLSFKAGLL